MDNFTRILGEDFFEFLNDTRNLDSDELSRNLAEEMLQCLN